MAIEKVSIGNSRLRAFGIDAGYYRNNGVETHIQDLATAIAVAHATAVRDELDPLSRVIRMRNKRTEKFGTVLAELNKIETLFDTDAQGGDRLSTNPLSADTATMLTQLGYHVGTGDFPSKAETQEYLQAVKSMIDALNNRSQSDMNRAQQLVEASNGSYDTASNLLDALVKSQSNTISGVGA